MPTRRVFVSVTSGGKLDDRRKKLKEAILGKLRAVGLEPQEFWTSTGVAANLAWNFDNVERVMRQCVAAVVIGFPRWDSADGKPRLAGEYNQFEGAIALTLGLPTFILAEKGVESRGIVWPGVGKAVTVFPEDAKEDWAESSDFKNGFDAWMKRVTPRKDVFLGYCSQNAGTAALIQVRLIAEGATVHNYAMDFRSGVSILHEIQEAAELCTCGIFLFGENDPLVDSSGGAAPRDNVVFEAGYFMHAKGPDRCLIIRQGKAKMPADLGGAIYLSLKDDAAIPSIEGKLSKFLENNL